MIYSTFAIISKFSWVMYPLGAFLVYCGIATFRNRGEKKNRIAVWVRKIKNVFKNISIVQPKSNLEFFSVKKKNGKDLA